MEHIGGLSEQYGEDLPLNFIAMLNPKCEHHLCFRIPIHGYPGDRAKFCSEHKKERMVSSPEFALRGPPIHPIVTQESTWHLTRQKRSSDVQSQIAPKRQKAEIEDSEKKSRSKRTFQELRETNDSRTRLQPTGSGKNGSLCKYSGCTITAHFGYKGRRREYCSTHRESGMVHLSYPCSKEGCFRTATFGYSKAEGLYCVKHKKDGMRSLASRMCKHLGCEVTANYCYPDGPIEFCFKHKKDGMSNPYLVTCKHPGCSITASYGYLGGAKESCFKHKKDGMIRVTSLRYRCSKFATM